MTPITITPRAVRDPDTRAMLLATIAERQAGAATELDPLDQPVGLADVDQPRRAALIDAIDDARTRARLIEGAVMRVTGTPYASGLHLPRWAWHRWVTGQSDGADLVRAYRAVMAIVADYDRRPPVEPWQEAHRAAADVMSWALRDAIPEHLDATFAPDERHAGMALAAAATAMGLALGDGPPDEDRARHRASTAERRAQAIDLERLSPAVLPPLPGGEWRDAMWDEWGL